MQFLLLPSFRVWFYEWRAILAREKSIGCYFYAGCNYWGTFLLMSSYFSELPYAEVTCLNHWKNISLKNLLTCMFGEPKDITFSNLLRKQLFFEGIIIIGLGEVKMWFYLYFYYLDLLLRIKKYDHTSCLNIELLTYFCIP